MAETTTPSTFIEEVKTVYGDLLDMTADSKFVKDTITGITESFNELSISNEKRAELLITLNSNLAIGTITKTLDQALVIVDKSRKIDTEIEILGQDKQNKINQGNLIGRQMSAFDDNLKVEKAKALANAIFGYSVGGLVAPSDFSSKFLSAIESLYPTTALPTSI